MRMERFTLRGQEAIQSAIEAAERNQHQQVEPEHLLLAMLEQPEGVVRRMVAASSRPGGWCLDFFAGSGTLGAVCQELGRRFVLVDQSPEAVRVMEHRLGMAAHTTSVRSL